MGTPLSEFPQVFYLYSNSILSSVVRFITSEHKRGPTEEDLTRSPEARLRVVLLDHTTILSFHCDTDPMLSSRSVCIKLAKVGVVG